MSDRLHAALLGMTDPARKLADALEEYSTNLGMGRTDLNAADIQELFDIKNALSNSQRDIPEPHAHLLTGIPSEILDRYKDMESEDQFRKRVDMARPMTTKVLDKMTMEVIAHQADELLHAIDMARQNVQGAIPLQTLDLVRGKVKDVLANLAGTIEKDM